MSRFKYAVGHTLLEDKAFNSRYLQELSDLAPIIHDIHFGHYDSSVIASGRFSSYQDPSVVTDFISEAIKLNFKPTLLINYLTHSDLKLVMDTFDRVYYKNGLRSVVVANLTLIKMLRDKYPDLYIQGSVLSYRTTESDLEEERLAGVDIHNPAAEIIRNPEQIIKNHNAGYIQKIMPFEGCLANCIHEKPQGGHRWSIARGIQWTHRTECRNSAVLDLRLFFTANWTTASRLIKLAPSIEVVKLPRGTDDVTASVRLDKFINGSQIKSNTASVREFIDVVENGRDHNVLTFNAVSYGHSFRKIFASIPSELFDDEFLDFSGKCGMKCEALKCEKCWIKAKMLNKFLRYPSKHKIEGVRIVERV